jgi:hypothetical protein
MRKRIICIILVLCLVIPLVLVSLVGCGSEKINAENAVKQIETYATSENSTTEQMLSSLKNGSSYDACLQYLKTIKLSDFSSSSDENKQLVATCIVSIPTVDSIKATLNTSKHFKEEYKAVSKDKRKECIYGYLTNILLSSDSLKFTETKLKCSGVDEKTVIQSLEQQFDSSCQAALSTFALTEFYTDEANADEITKTKFVEASDFSDFVVKMNKNRILISNVKISENDDALKQLKQLSQNNALIKIRSTNSIYFIQYDATNLSPTTITLENYFTLGNQNKCMFTNSGFHIEGLTASVKLKQGVTSSFCCALVGDASSQLYYYNKDLRGARHWNSLTATK